MKKNIFTKAFAGVLATMMAVTPAVSVPVFAAPGTGQDSTDPTNPTNTRNALFRNDHDQCPGSGGQRSDSGRGGLPACKGVIYCICCILRKLL